MKLSLPFIQLPLTYDAPRLAQEIAALGESVWMPHPQGFPGNSMLPLLAVDGEPANESFAGEMKPTPHLARCPYLMQTMASLGATLGRSRLMRLSGHAEVTRHADQGYYWYDRVRVHVPIQTQPTVRFECGDAQVNMAAGTCWIFDTWRQHRVLNEADDQRIHLVCDTVGGEGFWAMAMQGRSHDGRALAGSWQPRHVAPDPKASTELVLERSNVPRVMSPWEVMHRIGFLFEEAVPHPGVAALQPVAARFTRQWQSLWAAHGEDERGWPAYRQAVDAFMAEVRRLTANATLKNELPFAGAMVAAVGKMAVGGRAAAAAPAGDMVGGNEGRAPSAAVQAAPAARARRTDARFERPVFIVSSPRSGSTMLFEAMARAAGVYTIGGESHALIEAMPELHPATNGIESNRLTAAAATPAVSETLRQRFLAALRDRDGAVPGPTGRLRMLEKTPKNSLRVPFLAEVFPEAEFVYLYRDPRETMGSMIDAWNSGRFRTYPNLPAWQGPAWSLLLIPGWRELIGKPLGEVVCAQWETATRLLLDDLAALAPERVHVVRYDTLKQDAEGELRRLCAATGLQWDRPLQSALPLSRYTLSPPDPDKWRRHAGAIEPQLRLIEPTMQRAARFAGLAA
jgi:hypothetical protein